jgi:DNA-binding response OmpR family regulator
MHRCPTLGFVEVSVRVKLVLIVADSATTAQSVARSLEAHAGVQIAPRTSVDDALRLIQSVRPALIVVDLPSHRAACVCAEVRSQDGLENTPILALTDDIAEGARRLTEAGATELLRRPLDLGELEARARMWLRPGSPGTAT